MEPLGRGYVVEDRPEGRTVVVTGPWTPAARAAVEQADVDGVWLNYARGYAETDLSFIEPWPVRRLLLIDRSLTDLDRYHRPMLLTTGDGARLALTITGYQFPAEPTDEWDSNWLKVRIDADDGREAWTATDPSLLTFEAVALADWFDNLANGDVYEPPSFVEPNLRFEVTACDDSGATVRVSFELESRPTGAKSRVVGEHPLWIDFQLARTELHSAATSLRDQLDRYPPRAGR